MEEYKPYSDGRMEYDFQRHRYSLTADYLLSDRGIDLETVLAAGNASDRALNPAPCLRSGIWRNLHKHALLLPERESLGSLSTIQRHPDGCNE